MSEPPPIEHPVSLGPLADADPLLLLEDVAHYLGIGRWSAYDLVSGPNARLPSVRVGRGDNGIRVLKSDLLAYVASRRRVPDGPREKNKPRTGRPKNWSAAMQQELAGGSK